MGNDERRKSLRVDTKIHVHIFKEQRFFEGTMLDISVWGARIKCKGKIEDLHTLRIGFIFDNKEYTLDAKMVEKLPDNLYRIAFTYGYIVDKMGIKHSLEDILLKK